MEKPKGIKGYVYCSECDIYYSKKLFDRDEETKRKMLKSKENWQRMMAYNMTGCPMCRANIRESLLSLASLRSDRHRLRSYIPRIRNVRSRRNSKKFLFIEKVKLRK